MALAAAETYLIVSLCGSFFGVPLEKVAGVATLEADAAAQLRENGVLAWQGFYCRTMDLGIARDPAPGDTAVVLELAEGRRVLVCDAKTSSRRLDKRWPVPKRLMSRHPAVREAHWDGEHLVHCLDPERAAA